jgi:hypothetical protein
MFASALCADGTGEFRGEAFPTRSMQRKRSGGRPTAALFKESSLPPGTRTAPHRQPSSQSLGRPSPENAKNLKSKPEHAFVALSKPTGRQPPFMAGFAFFVLFSGGVADF